MPKIRTATVTASVSFAEHKRGYPFLASKPATHNSGPWAAAHDCWIQHDRPFVEDQLPHSLVHAVNKNMQAEKIRKAVCDKIVDEISEELLVNTWQIRQASVLVPVYDESVTTESENMSMDKAWGRRCWFPLLCSNAHKDFQSYFST